MSTISGSSTSLNSLPASALRIRSASAQNGSMTPAAQAQSDLQSATNAIVSAFGRLTVSPTTTPPLYARSPLAAMLNGRIARLAAINGAESSLAATQSINTQSSTVRSSTDRIGLDLAAAAVSRLRSSVLGLDVTSPSAPSQLASSSSIGLDVTTPNAASRLTSSAALGLNTTSPNAVSSLSSSRAIGLDTTAPERASTLASNALGLDLTSADAPSTLASITPLGLDVISPERASVLASSATLGLDVTSPERSSTITSTGELNTGFITAYGSNTLTFPTATSTGTLTGTYTGNGAAANAASLTINLLSNSSLNFLLGVNVQFNVTDQANNVVFSFNGSLRSNDAVYLGDDIGLTVSFSGGSLKAGKSATTTVSKTPITVDGNATFNHANASFRPQFDAGVTVAAGSFGINGTSITVNANDSINTVVLRINASTAGVTAALSGDKLTLTSNAASEDNIVISGDTSGFVAATKLSGAMTSKGNVRDNTQVLAKTWQFTSVSTGSFTVNGATIAVNKTTDSVQSIVGRINASTAGVTASYDATADKLVLTSNENSEDQIVVGSDTTGFLSAAHLSTANTARGNIADNTQLLAKTTQFGSVASGAFTINGVAIGVDRSTDSLASVVARINGANAGVSAAYDSANDKVVLTSATNSEGLIEVGSDITGFLAAAKLSTANTQRGHLSEDTVSLYDLASFTGVTNGSFAVDGKTISVATTDSINAIVGKINSSGARVAAAFDASDNRIHLTTSFNTEDAVAIGDDTSGFLVATGITSTNTVVGNVRDDRQVLAKTSAFASVASGSLAINGVAIAIDKDADTLASVVDKINRANAGVTATYNTAADRVILAGTLESEDLIAIDDGGTSLADALHLATNNTVRGHFREDGVAFYDLAGFSGVVSGSFDVDGKTIVVSTSDSVNALVEKINNSGARVVASYDSAQDKLVLQASYDGEDAVPVGNDTSGFLAAAHLDSVFTIKGNIADNVQTLAKTSQFGAVTDGSFEINGSVIDVDANTDSVDSIIQKINLSSAGVVASFDASANAITLLGNDSSEDLIDVGSDTSGFLATAKLDGANTTRGNIRDDVQVLAKTAQFAGVTNGSFTVGGASIAIDTAVDSLSSIVGKINAANTGLSAAYDVAQDKIVLTNNLPSEDLIEVGGDTTGFLSAAGMSSLNTELGNIPDDQQILAYNQQFSQVMNGSFNLNGRSITIDTSSDTLGTIIARINAAGAGVTAWYNSMSDTITFTPIPADSPLSLDGDTSGFLAAVKINQGTVGTRANIDAAFNATGLSSPLFDVGHSVHAGAFTVNGKTINVAANDSIRSVLAKITESSAGVSATIDQTTQSVKLTAKGLAAAPITLGNDTSGFLSAVKLDGSARSVAGSDPTPSIDAVLAEMREYAKVHAGTLSVNGTQIRIDPTSTTIAGLVAQLNRVDGVNASLDEASGRVSLAAKPHSSPLRITDTSNVLSALGITTGSRRIVHPAQTNNQTNASAVAAQVAAGANAIGSLLSNYQIGGASTEAALRSAANFLVAAGAKGVSVSGGPSSPRLNVDQEQLSASLAANGRAFADRFSQPGGTSAVLAQLLQRFAASASASAHAPSAALTDAVKASFLSAQG
jgi:hypothetical protein